MDYLNCKEVADIKGVSVRRLQQMCKNNEIERAIKKGKSWYIPREFVFDSISDPDIKKPLPIGVSDFKRARRDYYYVDKSLLIKDFLDKKPQVSLFTRPRRFGKTLTMDMLRTFFEKSEEDNSIYFRDLKIWGCGERYRSYQGQYPVVFLSFKDIKCSSFKESIEKIKMLISLEFIRHHELFSSPFLCEIEKNQYREIAEGSGDIVDYEMSLQLLSSYLRKHYRKECVIIIDEYDTPLEQAYTHGYYDEMVSFIRDFFSGGFKDNSDLAFGFLTGVLRVAKESIFSGLNNLSVDTILDNGYDAYFGFTEKETEGILSYYGYSGKLSEVKEWYDGYRFGNKDIFNPWSIINYVANSCAPKAFWLGTSDNGIIGDLLMRLNTETANEVETLLKGGSVVTYIDTNVIYPEIHDNPSAIFSFLLAAGYLKIVSACSSDSVSAFYEIAIPNKEIYYVYGKEIIAKRKKENVAISFEQALLSGDYKRLEETLTSFIIDSLSSFDGWNENFYHGLMLGLCALLTNRYQIDSNKEAGLGRFDLSLTPYSKSNPAFLFEFKYGKRTDELESLSDSALKQIEDKKYDRRLLSAGMNNIIKIGIAFSGKKAVVKKA